MECTKENENLEQIKELINQIADSYDLPTEEQAAKMCRLTMRDKREKAGVLIV